jgi:comEA protein
MRKLLASKHSWFRAGVVGLLFSVLAQSASMSATIKKPPLQPINLNAATSEELQLVPGIGPATAEKILLMRKSYGSFKSVDDLLAIRGIGKKRLDKMRKYLIAGKPAAPGKPAAGNAVQPVAAGKPASCTGCAKTPPWLKENSVSARSPTNAAAASDKPADATAVPVTDVEPQLR